MKRYLEQRLDVYRQTGGEGLIAELVRVETEGGRISGDEMVAMVFLLLGAGSETTTHLISGSVFELLKDPALRAWLQRTGAAPISPSRSSCGSSRPCRSKPRYVRRDVQLGGILLRKGERIMAMLAAANMDPEANEYPERLDLERRPNRHIAFGTGIHFCLGHQLARIEGRCALEALLKRAGRNSTWPFRRTSFAGGSGPASGPLTAAGRGPNASSQSRSPFCQHPGPGFPRRSPRISIAGRGRSSGHLDLTSTLCLLHEFGDLWPPRKLAA